MLITNATFITREARNRILENRSLLIEDGHIMEIGKTGELQTNYPNEETLDENEITAKACEVAPKLWERYNKKAAKVL